MKKLLASIFVLTLLGALAAVPAAAIGGNSDCEMKRESGAMCDTRCTTGIGCFTEARGNCCFESTYACLVTLDCDACKGPGCTLGDF